MVQYYSFIDMFFLLIIFPRACSLSFNFTGFRSNDNITYEGSASPVQQAIELTRNTLDGTSCSGRATYSQPVHLWDKATRNITDFTTHFTFILRKKNESSVYGDGFAFFLGPAGSKIPTSSDGGLMGLQAILNQTQYSSDNSFVAVEFDGFPNSYWDPTNEHVGVDINSIRSTAQVGWLIDFEEEKLNEAWISYDANSLNLTIVFTSFSNGTITPQHLSVKVDLRDHLPEMVTFGFSAATPTGTTAAIPTIYSWDFSSSSLELAQPQSQQLSQSQPQPPFSRKNRAKTELAVGLGAGGLFVLIAGLGLVSISLWKKWKQGTDEEDQELEKYMGEDFGRGIGPRKYSYAELAHASNNFKDEHKLGQGGFGSVYRGHLKDTNSYVAIKKVSEGSNQGIKEFASEVRIISRLRHRNLVQLIGWCHGRKVLLLVYEYMPNGSLDFHLFGKQSLLKWAVRYNIARGLASALLYLHEEWEQCVLHRDIKSSNVMLDSEFNAKLGDFGLARLVDHARGAQTMTYAGTMGYIAPEISSTWRSSKESDVYSFGVVALEIACGRRVINLKAPEKEINIVVWVWGLYGSGRVLEAADPMLGGDFTEEQIKCLMVVGLWCAHPDPNNRPSIRQAIQVLNFEAPLPNLPSSLPVPTYLECPLNSALAPCSITGSKEGGNQNINFSSTSNTNSSAPTTTSDCVSPSVSLLSSQ